MEANIGMNIKVEIWNGHEIRFVEKVPGNWWAVAADTTKALAISNVTMALRRIDPNDQALISIEGIHRGSDPVNIISEFGIYKLVLTSRRPEARQFERWILSVIQALRKASGLEAFQVFRMLDKEHQKEAMRQLRDGLTRPVRVDFIKVNTIANKAVSTRHGYTKMLKKDDMTPDMLLERQPILDDTVALMSVNDSFGLGLSVSKAVYGKYGVQ